MPASVSSGAGILRFDGSIIERKTSPKIRTARFNARHPAGDKFTRLHGFEVAAVISALKMLRGLCQGARA
jgi:hypothetical protein